MACFCCQVPTVVCKALAVYDYEASKEDELTLHEGETIEVTEKFEDGWWCVRACVRACVCVCVCECVSVRV